MSEAIRNVEQLEALVGKKSATIDLKVIDHVDEQVRRWLAASPLAFVGLAEADRVDMTIAGGEPGFVTAPDDARLTLPRAALDDAASVRTGQGAGLLFLAPGLGETLRINGRIAAIDEDAVSIEVQECYVHCAKAIIRSDFWQPAVVAATAPAVLDHCRFMALATADESARADVSPKGDPAGVFVQQHGEDVCFADRPGNRRTDSFRNLLSRPQACAVFIVPGQTEVLRVSGVASLHTDESLRQAFAVQGKTPLLVTRLASPPVQRQNSPALARSRIWERAPAQDVDPAETLTTHVKLNRSRGLNATQTGGLASVSVPGLMRKGLDDDYKKNLY